MTTRRLDGDSLGWPCPFGCGAVTVGGGPCEPCERKALAAMSDADRLRRIGEIHGARSNDGHCLECFRPHPCVTYQLAIGNDSQEPR